MKLVFGLCANTPQYTLYILMLCLEVYKYALEATHLLAHGSCNKVKKFLFIHHTNRVLTWRIYD